MSSIPFGLYSVFLLDFVLVSTAQFIFDEICLFLLQMFSITYCSALRDDLCVMKNLIQPVGMALCLLS